LSQKSVARGAEPDECYVFGHVAEPERPDLVIEVVWTSGGIDKLDIYRRLAVPEVWYWRNGRISVHVLDGEQYREASSSVALAGIDLVELVSYMDASSTSQALRAYRDALRASDR
jgi:Uma2 family endonuclease